MTKATGITFLFAVTLGSFAQLAAAQDINLHCKGSGVATDSEVATVHNGLIGSDDHSMSTVQSAKKRDFNGSADVKIGTGFAKLCPPKAMLPAFNSAADDGCFDIHELKMGDTEISGEVKFNMLNSPEIVISRVTGAISISGMGTSFDGECEAIDTSAGPKF